MRLQMTLMLSWMLLVSDPYLLRDKTVAAGSYTLKSDCRAAALNYTFRYREWLERSGLPDIVVYDLNVMRIYFSDSSLHNKLVECVGPVRG